jgi:hypothetical protein
MRALALPLGRLPAAFGAAIDCFCFCHDCSWCVAKFGKGGLSHRYIFADKRKSANKLSVFQGKIEFLKTPPREEAHG